MARALLLPRNEGGDLDGRPRGVAFLVDGGMKDAAGSALLRGGIADTHSDAASDFLLLLLFFRRSKDCGGYGTRIGVGGKSAGSCEKGRNGGTRGGM